MRHETEWSFSWSFLQQLESRSATLRTPADRADALRRSAPRIPFRPAWRSFTHLCVLTIAGLHPGYRSTRLQLADEVAAKVSGVELLNVVHQELVKGHPPAYVRTVLKGRPGDLLSRLRFPLALDCGHDDEDGLARTRAILEEASSRCGLVVAARQNNDHWVARCALRALSRAQPRGAREGDPWSLRDVRVLAAQGDPLRARVAEALAPWSHGQARTA